MIARELITASLPTLSLKDSAEIAMHLFNEFKLSQLPVVEGDEFKGLITEDDILNAADPEGRIGDMRFSGWESAYVYQNSHLYDALDVMSNLKLEVLPVLDEDKTYLGVLTVADIITHLGSMFAVHEQGSIIVLEIPSRGYVLSQIGSIVESDGAKVLSLYLTVVPQTGNIILTLKVNATNPERIIASFERYEYQILRVYRRSGEEEAYNRNLDALMRFLEM